MFSPVSCLRLSADGEYLATGCGLTVNIYDTKTWKKTWFSFNILVDGILDAHGDCCSVLAYETMDDEDAMGINCICFSPDGQLLATAARDNIIRVRSNFCTLCGYRCRCCFQIKPLNASRFLALQIWSIADRQIRNRFLGHTGETLSSIVFSPDGRPIVSATGVGAVRIWDMSDGSSKTIAGTCSSLGSISPDARLVAAYDCNSVRRFLIICRMSDEFPSHRSYVSGTLVRANCWKGCGDQQVAFSVWPSPLMDVGS